MADQTAQLCAQRSSHHLHNLSIWLAPQSGTGGTNQIKSTDQVLAVRERWSKIWQAWIKPQMLIDKNPLDMYSDLFFLFFLP